MPRLKNKIKSVLLSEQFPAEIDRLGSIPPIKVVNALFPFLCNFDPTLKWHAVTLIGVMTAKLEKESFERANNVMRKLFWTLSDESGNIGWGSTEAMAEIMVHSPKLTETFSSILVSFLYEDGNFLEFEPLQAGALWGVNRMSEHNPALMNSHDAGKYSVPYLDSRFATIRALAASICGHLKFKPAKALLDLLTCDSSPVQLYLKNQFITFEVGAIASKSIASIDFT